MYVFTMSAEDFDELNPNKQAIRNLISKHIGMNDRLRTLERYYLGQHDILRDEERTNKIVCNHAKDIADTASSYFIGNPITYNAGDDADISAMTDALATAEADEADGDNGHDLSVYGRAYEYVFTRKDETELQIKNLSPKHTFVVYDDTIEQNELFAVYYWVKHDDTEHRPKVFVATVVTANYKYVLNIQDIDGPQELIEPPEQHFKGEVPIVEYLNNKDALGDYELQIPLIDAYNVLMSDRVTDKEQFIDAILAVYGTLLSDEDYESNGDGGEAVMEELKEKKFMEMPDGSKAEYLTRTYDESGVEILKKAIEQDIHKFSHIPCMSDESFGGNVSGVAMEFKLLGMENITKIKTRYYRKGLRKRLRIFANWLSVSKAISINTDMITPVFTRGMPKNLLEISQIVGNLWGKVSKKTLLSQIPFVADPDEELEAVEAEEEKAAELQKEMFGLGSNTAPDDMPSEDDEPKEVDKDDK